MRGPAWWIWWACACSCAWWCTRMGARANTPPPCAPNALCSCQDLQLACVALPLHRLPEWPSRSLRHVDVSLSNLGSLPENALDGLGLYTLVLVADHLINIEPKAFSSMTTTLSSLDLGYNHFTLIPHSALRDLRVLNWLNLQNNYIINITNDWSHMSESLTSLSLGNNHIANISLSSFSQLHRLSQLDLEGNRIRTIYAKAFPLSLTALKLSNNLLTSLPCHIFTLPHIHSVLLRNNFLENVFECKINEVKKLEKLDLSDNSIQDLKGYIISRNLHIRQLNLDFNLLATIPDYLFSHMKLEKLSISYNKLTSIGSRVFESFQHTLEQLELEHNLLSSLPKSIKLLTRLRHLSLSYNLLASSPELPPHLQALSLAGNFLTAIPSEVLQRISPNSLRYLDLSYNHISHLFPEHFNDWSGMLTTINLKGNKISKLEANTFSESIPIKEMLLSFNDLYYIHPETFSNISSSLQVLELSLTLFNGEFPVNWLSPLDNLLWVTLDNNNINTLTTNDLKIFPSLEYLDLEFNKIINFPVPSLHEINETYSLKDIKLSYNFIEKLHEQMFSMFPQLQSIDLSYNQIHNVTYHSISNLASLVFLSLSGNMISFIETKSFYNLPNIVALELQENQLTNFSLNTMHNVSGDHTTFTLNISRNYISDLIGDSEVPIQILDCSHNLLREVPKSFLSHLANHIRQIIFSYNNISHIDTQNFGNLTKLEILNIHMNNIRVIKRRAFSDLESLQVIDLSNNNIHQIAIEQFANLRQLRYVKLDKNSIKSIPRDVFKNTVLEHVDLSFNQISIYPSTAFSQIGFTLRHLDVSSNNLEYLDSSMFQSTPFLLNLIVRNNKLTILSDNVFTSLGRLHKLDISFNSIKANYKELFHYLPNLHYLNLAGSELKSVPYLPLLNLTHLNLSSNHIHHCNEDVLRHVKDLRELYLSDNRLTTIVPKMWTHLKLLTTLDLSHNPIKKLMHNSFRGLEHLLHLKLNNLPHLEVIESDTFRPLISLHSLYIQTWSSVNKSTFQLADVVRYVESLHKLVIHVTDSVLSEQLHEIFNTKLRHIEIWGSDLTSINASAFTSCVGHQELYLKITQTSISDLPHGFLEDLGEIPHFGLDLSNNKLTTLSPAAFYPNVTSWNRVATKLLSGGLVVSGNPLRCECSLAWAGGWLRRWLREAAAPARALREAVRSATCTGPGSARTPLLRLHAHDADCHASALAAHARAPRAQITLLAFCFLLHYILRRMFSFITR